MSTSMMIRKRTLIGEFANIGPFRSTHSKDSRIRKMMSEEGENNRVSLYLAQHVKNHEWYKMQMLHDLGHRDFIILDNGAFEGGALAHIDLANLTEQILEHNHMNKFAVIAPDYPGEDPNKTWESAVEFDQLLQKRGLRDRVYMFYVPQGRPRNRDDIRYQIEILASETEGKSPSRVDGVCFSILASPIAMGALGTSKDVESRIKLIDWLLRTEPENMKKVLDRLYVHWLGLFNAPGELELIPAFLREHNLDGSRLINSFDSAAAWKAGYLHQLFETADTERSRLPKPNLDAILDLDWVLEDARSVHYGVLNSKYIRNIAKGIREFKL